MSMPPTSGDQPENRKAAAAAAKAYAKAERPWYKKKRVIIPAALVAIMVIASAAGAGGSGDDENDQETTSSDTSSNDNGADDTARKTAKDEPKDEAKDEAKPKPQALKVEATAIIKEFEQNEFAADQKYDDKTLQVSGRVNKIDTDMFDSDKYILRIGGGGDFDFLTVNCEGLSKDELSALSVGQKVTVVGEFEDGGDLGVEMKDCAVV